jgi:hypothetical protein
MNSYPAVGFLVRHGNVVAIVLSALPVLAAAWLALGGHWWWAVLALCAAPVTYLFVKSYMELVALISDMLIPK